jgi:hypothetical protein
VTCSVQARFGDDPITDIVELAARTGASVVLVWADWATTAGSPETPTATAWPADMNAAVVLVPLGFTGATDGPVTALIGNEAHSRAALRVAADTSQGRRTRLYVMGADGAKSARRAHGTVDALQRAGFAGASLAAGPGLPDGTGLVILGADVDGAGLAETVPCVRVYAGTRDGDRDLEEIAARIAVG